MFNVGKKIRQQRGPAFEAELDAAIAAKGEAFDHADFDALLARWPIINRVERPTPVTLTPEQLAARKAAVEAAAAAVLAKFHELWDQFHDWTANGDHGDAAAWLEAFASRIPGGCTCPSHFRQLIKDNPSPAPNATIEEWVTWGWMIHDQVSVDIAAERHLSPARVPLSDALQKWGRSKVV